MSTSEMIKQARFIFSATLMIRDRIFKIHTANINKQIKEGGFTELSVPQLHAIMMIRKRGQVYMSELAGVLGVSPPSASAMVDRLFEKGVLTREHSREDRRKVIVRVSPEAEKDFSEFDKNAMQSLVDLVEKVGPETTRKWCDVLDEIKNVLDQEY